MYGYEVIDFLGGIVADLADLGNADIVSLIVRIVVTVFAVALLWRLGSILLRIVGDMLRPFSRAYDRYVSLPARERQKKRQSRRWQRQHEREEARNRPERERLARERQEAEQQEQQAKTDAEERRFRELMDSLRID